MLKSKIVVPTASLDAARSVHAVLAELLEPLPDAVTLFEAMADGVTHVVEAYYSEPPALDAVHAALVALADGDVGTARSEIVPDENWVAISQAAMPPVTAGRFVVHGSHDSAVVGRRMNSIEIDAGEAFGTAHHATTSGCLAALDALARRGSYSNVLDLGCGSGVLAIAAARVFPAATIQASDIDPIAVVVAAANARRNRTPFGRRPGTIRFHVATGLAHQDLRRAAAFDLVLANILAGPLIDLAPSLARAIKPGGRAVLSGLLTTQAANVFAAYRMSGFHLESRRDHVGWTALVLVRPCSRTGPARGSGDTRASPARTGHVTWSGDTW